MLRRGPGWAPGKQRINIWNEKLPTTGKPIRSLIPACYIDANRYVLSFTRLGVQGTFPTRGEAAGGGQAGQQAPLTAGAPARNNGRSEWEEPELRPEGGAARLQIKVQVEGEVASARGWGRGLVLGLPRILTLDGPCQSSGGGG